MSRAALDRVRPLLLARGTRGLVRRGHGDLHLGNIALIDGKPMPFDAIEFDPLIAAGDVLYDLSFLLMDLTERGLTAAANVVFNRYLAETRRDEDLDALARPAAVPLAARRDPRQGDGGAAERCPRGRTAEDRESRDDVFPVRLPVHRSARADARRNRRIVRHRQVGAGARSRAAHPAQPRRRVAPLGRGAQGDGRRRPRPSVCRPRPTPPT